MKMIFRYNYPGYGWSTKEININNKCSIDEAIDIALKWCTKRGYTLRDWHITNKAHA